MSITQLATFRVGDLFFGVDVHRVREVLLQQQLTPVPRAVDSIAGLMNLRGQVVTAVDLRRRTGRPVRDDIDPMAVVILSEGDVVAVLVDEIGDVIAVDSTTYEPTPATLPEQEREYIAGTYPLADSLLLVLDIERALDAH